MKKIVPLFLLVISLLSLSLFFFEDEIAGKIVEKNKRAGDVVIQTISPEEIKSNTERTIENHNEEIQPINLTSTIKSVTKDHDPILRENLIGQLIIPSRNTNIGILKGITEDNLLLGAGTMKLDQRMGEGNYALAGHYQFTDGALFNAIYDIQNETDVYITDKEKVYHYVVYARDIYPEDAFYKIEDEEASKRGNPILTLMTCPISSKDKTRIFASADLVTVHDWEAGMFEEATSYRVQ